MTTRRADIAADAGVSEATVAHLAAMGHRRIGLAIGQDVRSGRP